jgi:DNA-directed RNA polymerase specialized sigma24 family protein
LDFSASFSVVVRSWSVVVDVHNSRTQDSSEVASMMIGTYETDEALAQVQAVADSLDRVRELSNDLGPLVLLAELRGVSADEICAALDTITSVGRQAIAASLRR